VPPQRRVLLEQNRGRASENLEQFLSRYHEILNPGPLTEPTTHDSISFESLGLRVLGLVARMLQPQSDNQDDASSPLENMEERGVKDEGSVVGSADCGGHNRRQMHPYLEAIEGAR
jgi:hypothetical protein